ncbi:MAG: hypothetical protein CO150_01180 [Nitrospirae bacterium CG_4_9_14_3_um_filter_53_35]|nr:MAG: hypothetical protein AUK29_08330 [Nitrospirae bacterium CG2_30_53_67]PIS37034.1 MAG: hypothetical protein COT35_08095 [Nitrospirae bacterium CG08_land_8_20_14_0_20_52_24]PIV85501.1 MAG: hypothetical protein COW52_01925 [Nitrospirae bacterium CG17_big_fil_post_rev_8_21_14_2_50_50_9]PIW85834.1 MAG: hypothetical protein COZ95_02435 [Nitrospirae bacterium CG_4_8_14_3_um_filter_50_41]PIX86645.1 MAG: hypothetical protein COZ32_02235 [Nitrospirae bacterium CG_4_10_14_3_um_filter_53_41]PJA7738
MDRDHRIKVLAEHLIWAINQAYIDNDLIQEALNQIEEEGYKVDILLAAFTRFDRSDTTEEEASSEQPAPSFQNIEEIEDDEDKEADEDPPLSSDINEFDRTFLKLIKVGYSIEEQT